MSDGGAGVGGRLRGSDCGSGVRRSSGALGFGGALGGGLLRRGRIGGSLLRGGGFRLPVLRRRSSWPPAFLVGGSSGLLLSGSGSLRFRRRRLVRRRLSPLGCGFLGCGFLGSPSFFGGGTLGGLGPSMRAASSAAARSAAFLLGAGGLLRQRHAQQLQPFARGLPLSSLGYRPSPRLHAQQFFPARRARPPPRPRPRWQLPPSQLPASPPPRPAHSRWARPLARQRPPARPEWPRQRVLRLRPWQRRSRRSALQKALDSAAASGRGSGRVAACGEGSGRVAAACGRGSRPGSGPVARRSRHVRAVSAQRSPRAVAPRCLRLIFGSLRVSAVQPCRPDVGRLRRCRPPDASRAAASGGGLG